MNIEWHKLPSIKDEGYEVTKHSYSDTFTLRLNGSRIADQVNSMNFQGDRYIHAVLTNRRGEPYLHVSAHSPHTEGNDYGWGKYGSHLRFKEICEKITGQKFEELLRR